MELELRGVELLSTLLPYSLIVFERYLVLYGPYSGVLSTGVVALASSHCCRSVGKMRINLAESRRARSRPAAISFLTKRGVASRYSASFSTVQGLDTTGSLDVEAILIAKNFALTIPIRDWHIFGRKPPIVLCAYAHS
jgi:hypothetical protein